MSGISGNRVVGRMARQRKDRPFWIGAIDCETDGLNGKLMCWTIFHEKWPEPLIFHSFGEVLEKIFSLNTFVLRKTRWYAHNAEYDWRYAVDAFSAYRERFKFIPKERMEGKLYAIEVQIPAVMAPPDALGNVVEISPKEKVTEFCDSMAIFPKTAEEFFRQFAPHLPKIEFNHETERWKWDNLRHVAYAKRDVEGLVAAIAEFDALVYRAFGVHLKGTISSTAYQACLRFLPDEKYYPRVCRHVEDFIRKSYVGGLVRINADYGRSYENVAVVDYNSRYPASMRMGVPCGKVHRTRRLEAGPGFYRIIATVPDAELFPVIAYRDKQNNVSFPVGHFETYTTWLEIEEGLRRGYDIEILDGYVFESLEHPFNDFVDVCEKLRNEFKKQPMEEVVKLIQNSVYGKFGTRPEGKELLLLFEDEDVPLGWCSVYDEDTDELISYYCFKETERDAPYMLPHWASTITANSRLCLFELAKTVGEDNFRYGDTDSAQFPAALLERVSHLLSPNYGDLKLEKIFKEVKYWAPKAYTFLKDDGTIGAVYKGIPRNELKKPEMLKALHEGEPVRTTWPSGTSFQTFLRTGDRFKERTRASTNPSKVRSHRLVDGGWRPRKLDE